MSALKSASYIALPIQSRANLSDGIRKGWLIIDKTGYQMGFVDGTRGIGSLFAFIDTFNVSVSTAPPLKVTPSQWNALMRDRIDMGEES